MARGARAQRCVREFPTKCGVFFVCSQTGAYSCARAGKGCSEIAQVMAALGASELHARWKRAQELLATGVVTLGTNFPAREDDLYDDVALKWRARTKAAEMMSSRVPDRHGIDDSFLNVALRRLDNGKEEDLDERDEALGCLASFTADRSAEEGVGYDSGLGAGSCDGALGRWGLCGRGRLALGRRRSCFKCRRRCAEAIVSGVSACRSTTSTSTRTSRSHWRMGQTRRMAMRWPRGVAARRRWFHLRAQPTRVVARQGDLSPRVGVRDGRQRGLGRQH